MIKVVVTGASGFIGNALCNFLVLKGFEVIAVTRKKQSQLLSSKAITYIECDYKIINPFKGLGKIDAIIHLAGIAHSRTTKKNLDDMREINYKSTIKLAQKAVESNVDRFIFLSSIGVNGAYTKGNDVFTEVSHASPHNFYTKSKYDAELKLSQISSNTDMDFVVIRSPMVYGHNAPGSFRLISSLVKRSWPIPFSNIKNQRSFVALDNLIDFITLCSDVKKSYNAANQIFLISDNEDVSTQEFVRKLANAYKVKLFMFPFPVIVLRFIAKIFGKSDYATSLFSNLCVDSSKARRRLGWMPVTTMDEQMLKIAQLDMQKNK